MIADNSFCPQCLSGGFSTTQDSLNTDSTAWLISIQMNFITFQKTSWLHLRLPQPNWVPDLCGGRDVGSPKLFQSHPESELRCSCAVPGRNWTLSRKSPLLLLLRLFKLCSPSLSSCFMGVVLPGKQRRHLRKNTCSTSGNLASIDTGCPQDAFDWNWTGKPPKQSS